MIGFLRETLGLAVVIDAGAFSKSVFAVFNRVLCRDRIDRADPYGIVL
jgi:hypothetical protein